MCEYARVRESSREFAKVLTKFSANTRKFSGRFAQVRESSRKFATKFAKVRTKFAKVLHKFATYTQIRESSQEFSTNTQVRKSSQEFAKVRESSRKFSTNTRKFATRFAKVRNKFAKVLKNTQVCMEVRKDTRLVRIGYSKFAAVYLCMDPVRTPMLGSLPMYASAPARFRSIRLVPITITDTGARGSKG